MGAWGIKSFENDDAADWLGDLTSSKGNSLIKSSYDLDESYVEAPEGCIAIAATEVLLALKGTARTALSLPVQAWVAKNKSCGTEDLIPLAVDALKLILSDKSELKELWQESNEYSLWEKDILELIAKLESF
jgi:hypothetical protein